MEGKRSEEPEERRREKKKETDLHLRRRSLSANGLSAMSSSSQGVLGELLVRGSQGVFSGVAYDGEAGEGGGSFESGGHGFSTSEGWGSGLDRWVV